jgi:Catalase (peroxidase I)
MTDSQDWWPADYGHYGVFLSGWRGIVQEHIALEMAEVVQALECKGLRH